MSISAFLVDFLAISSDKSRSLKDFFHNLYKTNWGFVFSIVSRDVCTISILVSLPGFLFWRLIAIHMIRTVLYFAPVMLFGCFALVVAAPKLTKSVHWRFGAFFLSMCMGLSLSLSVCKCMNDVYCISISMDFCTLISSFTQGNVSICARC